MLSIHHFYTGCATQKVVVGMKILCQIISIQPLGIVVSLPNHLLGHIPIVQISSQLTAFLEKMDDDGKSDDSIEMNDDAAAGRQTVPDLSQLFHCGQYVWAVVTDIKPGGTTGAIGLGSGRDPTEKGSRRVELSLKPDQVNSEVAKADLRPNFVSIH